MVLFLLCIGSVSWAGSVNINKLNKKDWLQYETENFKVITDASPKAAVEMISDLENFNYFLARLMGLKQESMKSKIPVVLAKSESTLRALGVNKGYAGLFVKNQYGDNAIFANASRFKSAKKGKGSSGRHIIFHEVTHLAMNSLTFDFAMPYWFSEGIAEYFGTYTIRGGNVLLGDMSVICDRFCSMLRGLHIRNIDVEKLLKTDRETFKSKESSSKETNDFYAESAVRVHYLNADPARRKKMFQYLMLLKRGYQTDEIFEALFKTSYKEFNVVFNEYVRGRTLLARAFPVGKGGVEFPDVVYSRVDSTNRSDLIFLYDAISLMSDDYLGDGVRTQMNADIENLYPNFFSL